MRRLKWRICMVVSVRKCNYQIIMLNKICIGFNDILKIGLPWVNLKIASTAMFIRNSSVISVFANNGYEKRRKWFEWGKELKVRYMYCRIRIRVTETIQFSILTASNYIICKCNYIFFILA